MSRIFTVRFARLAAALCLAGVTTLTLTAAAGAKPLAPAVHMVPAASPLRTPSPAPESMPMATIAVGDLLPSGPSLPGAVAVLAVAALMSGIYLMISRSPGATRRASGQQTTVGKAAQPPSADGPVRRAA